MSEGKTDQPFVSRRIDKKVESKEQSEGMGARVRRSIGGASLRNYDPFLMLDEFNVAPPAGFPDHPHRGFETVTYMLPDSKGTFAHEDFAGHKGVIEAGDLQWMTAGRGIVHAEMPANQHVSHGLQLWINLAAKHKMCEPAYTELKKKDIPVAERDGVRVVVIAGEALGVSSPVYTRTPTHYLHFTLQPRTTLRHPIPRGFNAFAYTLSGEGYLGDAATAETLCTPHHTVTLTRDGDGVTVQTKEHSFDFVLLAGQPLNEPVVQYGPFVMNTQSEIVQAFRDYQFGSNGFDRAPGWRSDIGKAVRED